MDLGIAGKQALVCGASAGLGLACAQALRWSVIQTVESALPGTDGNLETFLHVSVSRPKALPDEAPP